MHDDLKSQLPLYVAGTLSDDERRGVELHLQGCKACQADVRAWQITAAAVREEAGARVAKLPPLSPVVTANLRQRPTMVQALQSAAHLIWSQWAVLRGLLPAMLVVLLLGILVTLGLRDDTQAALPLLALAPIVGALTTAFLHHTEADPAWEIVAATPTSPGALVFARLTLVLGVVVGVMLAGSLAVSMATAEMLGPLVAVWLGPLLLLSALATALAVRWTPAIAAGVSLLLWGSVVSTLVAELRGATPIGVSLRPLLEPGAMLLGGQLAGAVMLWWLDWHLLNRQAAAPEHAA